ncbi:hypothetical protein AUR64_15015 [Haloprofundus marisrubri]|uniref:Uncharacterized protein n=1 Tax=Haloprofundus marisrubri TaxID=1514971 RepID=A0A0W1R7L3_9EURY|nr:hypothetical protein [Haloprofundus marisrubri]KTG09106.1 hypothetical protein AUR64_15015 [Haloprofundus marisrubri]
MSLRNGFRQSWVLTFGIIAAMAWLTLTAIRVFSLVESPLTWTAPTIGSGATGGLVGITVMAVFVGVLVVLVGELGESTLASGAWLPEK